MAEPEAGQHAGLEWELAAEPQRVTHPHEMRGAGQLVVDAVEAAVGWDHPIPQYLAEPHHLEDRRAALGVAGQALLRHHEQRGALGTAQGVGEPFMQPGTGDPVNVAVPLRVENNFPLVNLLVNRGPTVPILLDTGSSSLVIPFWKIGWQNLGLPTGFDVVHYGNGVSIVYADVPTTVDFGGGAATTPTSVHVGILPYPRNLDSLVLIASGGAFGPNGNGILGIGPNVGSYAVSGPGNVVTTDLPGQLNEGTLIDIPGGYMQFGPNTGTPITSVTGAPITVLNVQIGGYDPNGGYWSLPSIFDSGGNHGTLPAVILGTGQTTGYAPPGTVISISIHDNQTLLYQYTTTASNSPVVTADPRLNTGLTPFLLGPVYISNNPSGVGTVVFNYPPP